MESDRPVEKKLLTLAHLPTVMLAIGYPLYWIELYLVNHKNGRTLWLGWILFAVAAAWLVWSHRRFIAQAIREMKVRFEELDLFWKCWLLLVKIFVLLIFMVGFYAALLPPHLIQETDALNYHITIPKQHLLLNSFQHIPWSTADLYLMPVDFALAPFWLATHLPNKFPQFIFLLGLVGVSLNLVDYFSRRNFKAGSLIVAALLGSHFLGIQIGTAMLDVVLCYLALAALDSLLRGSVILSAFEFSFYLWSKSFLPLSTALALAVFLGLVFFLKRRGFVELSWGRERVVESVFFSAWSTLFRRFIAYSLVFSLFVGGPFLVKSTVYTGTPLFPFAVGNFPSAQLLKAEPTRSSLLKKAEEVLNTRDQYGAGRTPMDFLQHLWLLAVPEKDVNNRYDYPVGLAYLLFLGPFLVVFLRSILGKSVPLLPLLVCSLWAVWWLGSHQSRFLMVPLVLMMVLTIPLFRNPSRILMLCVLLSLMLTAASVYRAHCGDFGKSIFDLLREKDRELLAIPRTGSRDPVVLDFPDAAYADFPVTVLNSKSVFVLENSRNLPKP